MARWMVVFGLVALGCGTSQIVSAATPLAESPLTPILGVFPSTMDFGAVPVDSVMHLQVTLFNDVDDPQSLLVIDSLSIGGYAFDLLNQPHLPLTIPGDGTIVPVTVRFDPPWPIIPPTSLEVTARNAINPHQAVTLDGEGILELDIPDSRIMGYDEHGRPLVCGTGAQENFDSPSSRGWECIPGVIRNNGTDSFVIEVDTKGPVTSVEASNIPQSLIPPQSLILRDDGLGGDRIAGDFIFTSGAFRYDMSHPIQIGFFGTGNDPNSPDGLIFNGAAIITITENDLTTTTFLEPPQIGLLRSDVPLTTVSGVSSTIAASAHIINIETTGRETQRGLHGLGGDISLLTNAIYQEFPDAADFFIFLSTDKVEALPRSSDANYTAGNHFPTQVNYSGTGLSTGDNTETFGSHGLLLGIVKLDTGYRGLITLNATHELEHQWGAHISPTLGLSDGSHYLSRSSVGSLLGGFRWSDNGNGTFTLDCTEGRGMGAHRASLFDKYLMGLIAGSSVVPMHVDNQIDFSTDCGTVITQQEIDRTTTIQNVQAMHGVRFPGPLTAERTFTLAFVAESHERMLNQVEMTFYEILADNYTRVLAPEVPDPYVAVNNWVPLTRFFSEGTVWRSDFPSLSPIGVPTPSPVALNAPVLHQAVPNPFNIGTDIIYELASREDVRLEIYDVHGRLIRSLVHSTKEAGYHTVRWNARNDQGDRVANGVYYYRLHVGYWEASQTMLLIK